MNEGTREPDEDASAEALFGRWSARREPARELPGARRRLFDALGLAREGEADAAAGRGGSDELSPESVYRRYREERITTPPATIDAILAAVQAEAGPLAAERSGEAAAEVPDSSAGDVAGTAAPAPLRREPSRGETPGGTARPAGAESLPSRLFRLPGRLLDRAGALLGGASQPTPLRRAMPALALGAVALAVAPLLLIDGGGTGDAGTTVASLPADVLDEANALAGAIDAAPATGMGFGGGDRNALAFDLGGAVTDLVVLANAERVPVIERSLTLTDTRLRRLADSLGEADVSAAAVSLADGARTAPADEVRSVLQRGSDLLRDALDDGTGASIRFDLGGALSFLALAATLEPAEIRSRGLDAAFALLDAVLASVDPDLLPPDERAELEALRALGSGAVPPSAEEVRDRVARLQLLLG